MRELTTLDDWQACKQESQANPIFVFKHSTACPISGSAYERVSRFLENPPERCPDVHLVKVIESRPVSNAVAADTGVQHASPQMLLLDGGKVVWSTSHGGIRGEAMREAVEEYAKA